MKPKEITHGTDSLRRAKLGDIISLYSFCENTSDVLRLIRTVFKSDLWLVLNYNNKVTGFFYVDRKRPIVHILPCSKYLNYNAVLSMVESYVFYCLRYNTIRIKVYNNSQDLINVALKRHYKLFRNVYSDIRYLRFTREQYHLNLLEEYQEYDTVVY